MTLVMHDREPFNQVWVDGRDRIAGFERYAAPADHTGRHRKHGLYRDSRHGPHASYTTNTRGRASAILFQFTGRCSTKRIPIRAHVVSDHYWQDMGNPERIPGCRNRTPWRPAPFQSAFPDDPDPACGLAMPTIDRRRVRPQLVSADRRQTCRIILADHGITPTLPGSEVNAFVRHWTATSTDCGLPVPRIHAHDGFSGLVFLEDLGDLHLQQMVRQASDPRCQVETAVPTTSSTPCWT